MVRRSATRVGSASRRAVVACGIAAVLAAGGLTAWALWPGEPAPPPHEPPEAMTDREVLEYAATTRFASLPAGQKQRVYDRLFDANRGAPRRLMRTARELDEPARRQLRRNLRPVIMKRMEQRVDAYFALAPDQREDYLDELIDERLARRAERSGPRPARAAGADANSPPRGQRRARRGLTPQRLKQHIEQVPADKRARFMTFFLDVRRRMAERGIDSPGRGPH